MYELVKQATKEFTQEKNRLNCAQAVFSTFSEKYGLSEEIANNIVAGFGGGFLTGNLCGAASGAVSVIGLKGEDSETTREKTHMFLDRFEALEGSLNCQEILNMTPQERVTASDEDKKKNADTCIGLVGSAVKILIDMGY